MASPSPTPSRQWAAVPPARAFGAVQTRPCPTSRGGGSAAGQSLRREGHASPPHEQGAGLLRFGSDGAVVRADGDRPTSRGGGSAAGQSLWRRADAPMPHEQGAWALRFGSDGAAVRADGDRPMSRGLSPAAVSWGERGRERKWTADMLRRPKRIIPQVPFAVAFSPAAQAGRRPAAVCCLPRAIRDRGHDIHGNRPGILF